VGHYRLGEGLSSLSLAPRRGTESSSDSPLEGDGFEPSVPRHGELMKFALTPCRSEQDSNFRSPATVSSVGALWRSVASGEIGAPERALSSAISSARRDSRTRRADDLGWEPIPGVAGASGCPHPTGLLTPICPRKRPRQVDGAVVILENRMTG